MDKNNLIEEKIFQQELKNFYHYYNLLLSKEENLKKEIENLNKILNENIEISFEWKKKNKLINELKKIKQFLQDIEYKLKNINNNNINENINDNINDNLENDKKEIIKLYEKEIEDNLKIKNCLNCFEELFIGDNNDCLYHKGNLKYFSCRECGDDEYFTCCNKCSKCLKGCIKSKHFFN